MKKRFSEEQIIGFLREADAGLPVKELCRQHGFSEASYYLWRSKFGGMNVSDATRLKEVEADNTPLKKLLAESTTGSRGDTRGVTKKVVSAPSRRDLVRHMTNGGLSERHALRVIGMSASSYRYAAAAASSIRLGHNLFEASPIGLGRQSPARGAVQVRRRKRKKVPVSERQPLASAANQTWSMDFVSIVPLKAVSSRI